ncbi:Flagellar protein FliS [Chlamydiales bacterium SCGC AB-751-O23]|jgi:flagellar secretion chaperone FliS|nr:Flagellar protein FliS [Chlamydiales bacterium SCGC AB-751-O23]
MTEKNPFSKTYKKQQIESASPGELVILLYDGAIDYLTKAQNALQEDGIDRIEKFHNNLISCQNIITELTASLDMEKGGEIAKNLFRLYDFMYRKLVSANLEKNNEDLSSIKNMLVQLRDAWMKVVGKEMGKTDSQSAQSTIANLDLQG